MRINAVIAQQPSTPIPNPPLPPSIGVFDGAVFLAIAGMVGAGLKQVWDYYQKKDLSGDSLTQTLIGDLRSNNAQLIQGNREGFKEMIEATNSLKQVFKDTSQAIHDDVQGSLKSQTGIYTALAPMLNEINLGVKALHARMDKQEQDRQN